VVSVPNKGARHFAPLWDGGRVQFGSRVTLCELLSEAGFGGFGFEGAGRLPLLWKSMVISARKPAGE